MAPFTADFNRFFKELAKNNNRDWFHTHKKRYEQSVKEPFEDLVSQLILRIQEHDPELRITPKDAILRINRDIRFSKDKSPYNLYVTAFLSRGGRKDKRIPGFFIRLSPEMLGIMVGSYGPDKEQLEKIRTAILQREDEWNELTNAPDFKAKFQAVRGDQHQRLPSPFKAHLDRLPALANKQFYALAELPPEMISRDDLADSLMEYWHAAYDLNRFLIDAIN